MLSKKALILINLVFGKESNIQFPAATASEIVEIREWAEKEERIKKTAEDSRLPKDQKPK